MFCLKDIFVKDYVSMISLSKLNKCVFKQELIMDFLLTERDFKQPSPYLL
jgi:hypothetical protein